MLKNKIRDVSSSWIQHQGEDAAETKELNQEPVQICSVLIEVNLKSCFEALEP